MAKINFTFTDEIGSNLNRYKAIDIKTSAEYTFDLSRMANITQVGTPLSAEYLNAIVRSINALYDSNYLQDTINRNIKFVDEKGNQTAIIEASGGGASFTGIGLTDVETMEYANYLLIMLEDDSVVYRMSLNEMQNNYTNYIFNLKHISNYKEGDMSIEDAFYDVDYRLNHLKTDDIYYEENGESITDTIDGIFVSINSLQKSLTNLDAYSVGYEPSEEIEWNEETNVGDALAITIDKVDELSKTNMGKKYIHNLYIQLYFVDDNSITNAGVKNGYFNIQIINSSKNEITDLSEVYNYIDKSSKNWIFGSYNFGNSVHMEKILAILDKQDGYALQFGQNGLIAPLGASSTKFTIEDSVIEM